MTFAPPRPTSIYGRAAPPTANINWELATQVGKNYQRGIESLGSSIGGAIEKYGLNKKEQQVMKGGIKSTVSLLNDLEKENPEHAEKYAIKREQLLDEDIPLAERYAQRQGLLETISISGQMRNADLTRQLAEGTLQSNIEMAGHRARNLKVSN